MKLSALLVAATLGVASAAPISLIYITNTGRTVIKAGPPPPIDPWHPLANIRVGHAAAFAQPYPIPGTTVASARGRSGCGGLRAKMDKVREMLGWTPIMKEGDDGFVSIMPVPHPFPGYPGRDGAEDKVTMARWPGAPTGPPSPFVEILPFPPHHRIREQSFWDRLHRALNQLGPWEGRAVTFVLGCGLGVLLRMFVVFGILLVRARRAASQQQPIELPVEGEVIFVAPPQYLIEEGAIPVTDEKAPVYQEVAPEMIVDLDAKKDGEVVA